MNEYLRNLKKLGKHVPILGQVVSYADLAITIYKVGRPIAIATFIGISAFLQTKKDNKKYNSMYSLKNQNKTEVNLYK